jgi:hypothetical protein
MGTGSWRCLRPALVVLRTEPVALSRPFGDHH